MTPDEQRTLTRIETIVEDLHLRMFGRDGDGGYVGKTDDRLKDLESKWSLAKGFFWAIGAVLSFLGLGGVIHIMRGGK